MIKTNNAYTYKEICEIRQEKQKYGNSKKAQIKEWARHFKWEYPLNPKTKKPSKKFYIIEVYDEPLDKVENRGGKREGAGRKGIYAEVMRQLILALANKGQDAYTKKDILRYSGLISDYSIFQKLYSTDEDNKSTRMRKIITNNFTGDIQSKFFSAFRTAMKHSEDMNIFTDNSYLLYGEGDWNNRKVADTKQYKKIIHIQNNCLNIIQEECKKDFKKMELINKSCHDLIERAHDEFKLTEGALYRIPSIYKKYQQLVDKKCIAEFGKKRCKCFIVKPIGDIKEFDGSELMMLQSDIRDIFAEQIDLLFDKQKTIKDSDDNEFTYNCYKDENNKRYDYLEEIVDLMF